MEGGHQTVIDAADCSLVSQNSWHMLPSGKKKHSRASHNYVTTIVNGKMLKLHRLLMGVTDPKVKIDHIDGDGLNNCRSNLRAATNQQNCFNSTKPNTVRPPSSLYKGVCWDKARDKWHVGIKHNYKKINIGRFDSEIKAAQAYDQKAMELFGEFAKLNFPK